MSDQSCEIVCHAPGELCLGCDHYKGKAAVCKYAPTPVSEKLKEAIWAIDALEAKDAEIERLTADLKESQEHCEALFESLSDATSRLDRIHNALVDSANSVMGLVAIEAIEHIFLLAGYEKNRHWHEGPETD